MITDVSEVRALTKLEIAARMLRYAKSKGFDEKELERVTNDLFSSIDGVEEVRGYKFDEDECALDYFGHK